MLSASTSSAAAASTVHHAGVVIVPPPAMITLLGTITGDFVARSGGPGVGPTYLFRGSGRVHLNAQASMTGHIKLPGAAGGQASGILDFTTSKGTLEISVTGPTEPPFGPFPQDLTFTIVKGTGAYKGATGTGAIEASLTSETHRFSLEFSNMLCAPV